MDTTHGNADNASLIVPDLVTKTDTAAKSPGTTLSSLTSLRFIAALFVVIHHTRPSWKHFPLIDFVGQVGWLGVSFFFVLSGFVLMWSFNQNMKAADYIYRRLTRIYPLHFVTLIFSILTFIVTGVAFGGYVGTVPGTLASLLLLHDWIPGNANIRQGWNGVSWTLSCEFFFYVCVPFIFPALLKQTIRRNLILLFIFWILMLVFVFIALSNKWSAALDFCQYHPVPRMLEFLAGACAARIVMKSSGFRSPLLAVASMVVPILCYCLLVPEALRCSALMNLMFAPGVFWFVGSMATSDLQVQTSWLKAPQLVKLGEASFGLYMTHALLLPFFTISVYRLFPMVHSAAWAGEIATIVFAVFAIALSVTVHKRFEIPVRNYLLSQHRTASRTRP